MGICSKYILFQQCQTQRTLSLGFLRITQLHPRNGSLCFWTKWSVLVAGNLWLPTVPREQPVDTSSTQPVGRNGALCVPIAQSKFPSMVTIGTWSPWTGSSHLYHQAGFWTFLLIIISYGLSF